MKVLNDLRPAEEIVIRRRREFITTWRGRSNLFWFIRLLEEILELGLSLMGLIQYSKEKGWHKETVSRELMGIASICINWIEYLGEETE